MHLDGGYESSGDVRAEQRGHVEFSHILLLAQGAGDALLAQELETGHPVLHTYHVERRPASQEQTRVSVTPTDGGDGPLKKKKKAIHNKRLPTVNTELSISGRSCTQSSKYLFICFVFAILFKHFFSRNKCLLKRQKNGIVTDYVQAAQYSFLKKNYLQYNIFFYFYNPF